MKNNCSSVKMSEELTRRGYADGSYMCICKTCGGIFQGDKRAWTCKGCATSADRIEQLEADRDELSNQNGLLRDSIFVLEAREQANYKRGMEDAAKIVEYHAGICTDRHDRHWLGDIANLIRAKIQERGE